MSTSVAVSAQWMWVPASHDRAAATVDRMASSIADQLSGASPKLVLQFDCAGRGKAVFRDQTKSELLARLQQKVAPGAPWLGFYTYGEIGPVGGENCFHNYTAVVAAFS